MITLLAFICMASGQCGPVIIAGGFVHEAQCQAYSHMMLDGWIAQHPEAKIERALCTPNPEYVIGKWML